MTPPTAEAEFAAPASADVGTEEAPRRRSTIREPAPVGPSASQPVPSQTLPPQQPVISLSSPEENGQPKRGWWAKRLLGGKS